MGNARSRFAKWRCPTPFSSARSPPAGNSWATTPPTPAAAPNYWCRPRLCARALRQHRLPGFPAAAQADDGSHPLRTARQGVARASTAQRSPSCWIRETAGGRARFRGAKRAQSFGGPVRLRYTLWERSSAAGSPLADSSPSLRASFRRCCETDSTAGSRRRTAAWSCRQSATPSPILSASS